MAYHYCYVFSHTFCFFCAESTYILVIVIFFSPSVGVTLPSFERNRPKVRRSTSLPSCNDRCNRSRSFLTMLRSSLIPIHYSHKLVIVVVNLDKLQVNFLHGVHVLLLHLPILLVQYHYCPHQQQ